MEHIRDLKANAKRYGVHAALGTFVWNVRFTLGYRIGGFTQAKRS